MIALLLPSMTLSGHADNAPVVGTLITHPLNATFQAVQTEDHHYFSIEADGTHRLDPVCSADQAFVVGEESFLVARRKHSGLVATYVVPFVTFDGPAIP